jgi:heat shock protein HslJ
MKKTILLSFSVIILIAFGCSSAPSSTTNFTEVTGKEWKLIQVKIEGRNIHFNRKELIEHEADHIFTLNFDAQTISGVGAPNRYNAPYTLGDLKERAITINPMRSTLMAALWQPEKLKEYDFFIYMQNIYKWDLTNNQHLELHSKTEDNKDVVLVFSISS